MYTVVIVVTFVGFFALAALLLVPIWRFLTREEQVSRRWTQAELERREVGREHDTNGPDAKKDVPGV